MKDFIDVFTDKRTWITAIILFLLALVIIN